MAEQTFNVNVALIGAISSGKSTFLNALFSEHYSENKIKRTTMCPQIYTETNETCDNNDILVTNSSVNQALLGNIKTINDLKEIKHNVETIHKLIVSPYRKNIKLSIHDLPGLNDVETKDVYYKYVRKNFHNFDIVVYIIDIKSALNTTDEADILDFIMEGINHNNKKYNICTRLIILANKCDNMEIKSDSITIDIESKEHFELYQQIEDTINSYNKYNIEYKLMPISCENAFIYNLLCNSPNKLTDVQMNKVGINYFGKIYWNKIDKTDKLERLLDFVNDKNNSDIVASTISNTGFEQFKNYFNEMFIGKKGYMFVNNKCKYSFYSDLLAIETTIDNSILNNTEKEQIGNHLILTINQFIKFIENSKSVFNIDDLTFKKINTYIHANNKITTITKKFLSIIPKCRNITKLELENFMIFKKLCQNLHNEVKYFNNKSVFEFIQQNNSDLSYICHNNFNDKIKTIATYTDMFRPFCIGEILDILVNYCDIKDVSKYIILLFSCESLYNGIKTEFRILNSELIVASITYEHIHNIIEFYKTKYFLSEKVIFSIKINVIIGMYKYIISENKRNSYNFKEYLGGNVGSMLFQMDKFWNNGEIDKLLLHDFDEKYKIKEIQYLASETRLMTLQNKNYVFSSNYVSSNLPNENYILNYITKHITS